MRQTRVQKRVRLARPTDEPLPRDPRDPDILRAKRLLLQSERHDPTKRAL